MLIELIGGFKDGEIINVLGERDEYLIPIPRNPKISTFDEINYSRQAIYKRIEYGKYLFAGIRDITI